MPRLIHQSPAYRHHKASGQAIVTIDGRDTYLGPWRSKASRADYDRVIGEWLANGRRSVVTAAAGVSVAEVIAAFWSHAQTYYRHADGTPTNEVRNFKEALRPLRRLYERTPANDFGPLALQSLVGEMVRLGWARTYINRQLGRVKHVFKWAASQELAPASIHQALLTVPGLKAGRCTANESEAVKPIDERYVHAVLPFVSRQVGAMIQLQLLTGMRPGEVCSMRTGDIERSAGVWMYRPVEHKTQHHGHDRQIPLGPKAQDVIKPFLKLDPSAHLFSPAEAERERRESLQASRRTPLSCGNRPGTNRQRRPRREPGVLYSPMTYHRAIRDGCDKANAWAKRDAVIGDDERIVPRWHPHQLRHTAATRLRREFGLEAAQVILGHRTLTVTQLYAEKNVSAACSIMERVG